MEDMRAPGWYRNGWTAEPESFRFTSKWGIVAMGLMGWVPVVSSADGPHSKWPKRTITAAMKEVERLAHKAAK